MKPWQEITPQEFAAMSESEKRELARQILTDGYGHSPLDPGNVERDKVIEGVLNAMYGPVAYHIAMDGKSITCHTCGLTSYHPKDVEQRYCGKCHKFHDDEADKQSIQRMYDEHADKIAPRIHKK